LIGFLRGQLINHGTRPSPRYTQSNPVAPVSLGAVGKPAPHWKVVGPKRLGPTPIFRLGTAQVNSGSSESGEISGQMRKPAASGTLQTCRISRRVKIATSVAG
jgi:hypothetical protein